MSASLGQLLAILWSSSSVAQLRDVDAQAREAMAEIDAESERGPAREAATLARMMSPGGPSTGYVLEELRKFDDESSHRAQTRKVVAAIAAAANSRVRELEAIEASKPAEQRRREQEQAEREAKLQGLYARIPVLFRSDFLVSKLGQNARSRTPRPAGSHTAYVRDCSVDRVLGQGVMEATRCPGWPPRYSDFTQIERPDSAIDADEKIVLPLRELCQKSSVSEDEAATAIDRAQTAILRAFSETCSAIRSHYPDGLPRFIALPAFTTPRAQAAE